MAFRRPFDTLALCLFLHVNAVQLHTFIMCGHKFAGGLHHRLHTRVFPAHDFIVFVAFVRPDNHAVEVFDAGFEHGTPFFG